METLRQEKVDILHQSEHEPRLSTTSIALQLGTTAVDFARVERVPRYDERRRENDAEHSFMLALVATELAQRLYPSELDAGLVSQYSIVHDLVELKTGDVATLKLGPEELAAKEAAEQAALTELLAELPPHTRQLVEAYERQDSREARFVRAIDKLLPIIVDIVGAGRQVMREDYGITSSEALARTHDSLHGRIARKFGEFPQVVADHGLLCELFELEFDATPQR